ncbi:MAG: hypothetical protein FWG99_03430 [Treponema sp.]|nr:hypothetical protein [Treponema sp.]
MEELVKIVTKFSESGWDLIEAPSKAWLVANKDNGKYFNSTKELIKIIERADAECGNCGCEFDPLYKKALELLNTVV